MSKLRFQKRFIYVGVDISFYALLSGGRSSYLLGLACTVPTFSVVPTFVFFCVMSDYPRHGHVLYRTILIKTMCVHHLYLQG